MAKMINHSIPPGGEKRKTMGLMKTSIIEGDAMILSAHTRPGPLFTNFPQQKGTGRLSHRDNKRGRGVCHTGTGTA